MLGTISNEGITNIGLFNSVFHLGANPSLLGFVLRPDTPDHDTYDNILETGEYTFNNVIPEYYEQAHQTSASFPSGVSEFLPCGFTKFYINGFKPPFVNESTIKIGLEFKESVDININNTKIIIGEIVKIIIDERLIVSDGYVDHIKAKTITVAGLDSYFSANALGRLSYAKPGEQPLKLKVY